MNTRQQLGDLVLLRYRAAGHLRFSLPEDLCTDALPRLLRERVGELEGVYRVFVYTRYRKLSIRYLDTICSERDVILHLDAVISELASGRVRRRRKSRKEEAGAPAGGAVKGWKGRFLDHPWVDRVRERYRRAKATVTVLGNVASSKLKTSGSAPMSTEKLVINFLNDLLSFYLIKLHWDQITKQWLRHPLQYRYQLLSAFYLVFLLVRYRKAGGAKAGAAK